MPEFLYIHLFNWRTKKKKIISLRPFYTCDKQVLWESAGAFFPRDNSLISRSNSHVSRVRGLVVRCLLFNPEVSCSNPLVCANFFTSIPKQKVLTFFGTMRLFGFVRLFFEIFLMSPKRPPFNFLISCNRTNVIKSWRVLFSHFSALCDLAESSKKIRKNFSQFLVLKDRILATDLFSMRHF